MPQRRSWAAVLVKRIAIWICVAAMLFAVAIVLPHPKGIWYFGTQYPKWVVTIDSAGFCISRENGSVPSSGWESFVRANFSGWVPVIIAKLVAYGLPVWLIWRFAFRSRRGRPAAGERP
jgi:hypothetical protein